VFCGRLHRHATLCSEQVQRDVNKTRATREAKEKSDNMKLNVQHEFEHKMDLWENGASLTKLLQVREEANAILYFEWWLMRRRSTVLYRMNALVAAHCGVGRLRLGAARPRGADDGLGSQEGEPDLWFFTCFIIIIIIIIL
jgi:hypothetical protein